MAKEVLEAKQDSLLQDEKTFNRNKWLFCTSGIGRDALYTLVSTYFLTYVQFGLTLTLAQYSALTILIGVVGRIWDGINDPMMGAIVEGTHMKWGKFKPWIFIGAVLDSLLTLVLFNLGRNWNGWLYVVVICLVYLLWEAAFTMNDIGYWSMIPSLSRTKERRDKISTLTVFFAGIGTIFMTGLYTLFAQGHMLEAFTVFSIIACVMVIGMQTYTAFGVTEGPREDMDKISEEEKAKTDVSLKKMVTTIFKNKQLLWMSFAHLCNSCVTGILLGLIYNFYYLEVGYDGNAFIFVVCYAVVNTLLQLLYPKIAAKTGRKKIQLVSYIVTVVGFVGMASIGWGVKGSGSFLDKFLPFNLVTLCIFGILIFAGNTLFYTANIINFNNCVEYNEYVTGERSEAVVTTMRPLIVKFADAVKYLTITVVLAVTGLYGLSGNISNMETQVNYVKNVEGYVKEGDSYYDNYKTDLYSYITEYRNLKVVYDLYEKPVKENGELDTDAISKYFEEYLDQEKNPQNYEKYEELVKCQFNAAYFEPIGDLLIIASYYTNDEDGNVVSVQENLGSIKDFPYIEIFGLKVGQSYSYKDKKGNTVKDTIKYSLSMTYTEDGETTNIANSWFYDVAHQYNAKGYGIRIGVRIAFCIFPLLLQTISIIVQRKKFIIDEAYYDKITKEIEERKASK